MSKYELIFFYLLGWLPMIYIGMTINDRQWKKAHKAAITQSYDRGWNAGFGYLQRISDAKTEQISGVTIKAEKV